MENQFYDEATGVTFLLPCDVRVAKEDQSLLVEQWKANAANDLLVKFRATSGIDWHGDEVAKKQELLQQHLNPGQQIEIAGAGPPDADLDTHPPLTTEA
jgi:hypothetical protein